MARRGKLNKVILCHTNDFPPNKNDKIRGWVENNGGIYSKDLTDEVTHLVASTKAWKRCSPLVKEARRKRSIQIVKLDWLEDTLSSYNKSSKKLKECDYIWEHRKIDSMLSKKVVRRNATSKITEQKADFSERLHRLQTAMTAGVKYDKACQDFEKDMHIGGFHPYKDTTGFIYIIHLLRPDFVNQLIESHQLKVGGQKQVLCASFYTEIEPGAVTELFLFPSPMPLHARPFAVTAPLEHPILDHSTLADADNWAQCIQLFESNDAPLRYACYLQYSKSNSQKYVQTLAPPGSTWAFAWKTFTGFFSKKCKILWHERPEPRSELYFERRADDDNPENPFVYVTPRKGQLDGDRTLPVRPAGVAIKKKIDEPDVTDTIETMPEARDGDDCV